MNIAFCSIGALRNEKEATRITLLNLARELRNRGHFVTILGQKAAGCPDRENVGGIIIRRERFSPIPLLFTPAYAVKKAEKEMKLSFDLIHCFSSTPFFALSGALTKVVSPRAKIVHTLRSYSRTNWGNSGFFLLNLAAKVTVPHQTFAKRLGTVSKDKVSIIPSSIDHLKFFPQNKRLLKEKYGYENNQVILHYGAMWPGKGTDLLLHAVSLMVASGNSNNNNNSNSNNNNNSSNNDNNGSDRHSSNNSSAVRLILAPRYSNIQHLRDLVEKLKIRDHVKFVTGRIKIEDYVNLADLVVLPYRDLKGTEGNPSCLLEAMACKTAVVTTRIPEIEEITGDSVFLVKPNTVKDLADTILLALRNHSPAMIEKAYLRAQDFSISNSGQKYLKLYQDALRQEKRR